MNMSETPMKYKTQTETESITISLPTDDYTFLSCLVKRGKFANIEAAVTWIVEEWTTSFLGNLNSQ